MAVSIIVGSISLATVFLLGCVGEIITEKAGNLNLGIPGIMCTGTAGGCFGAYLYMSSDLVDDPKWIWLILISLFFCCLFAAITSAIYATLTVSLRCNQNITGLAVTIFGSGFTQFFMDNLIDLDYLFDAGEIISKGLPFAGNLGWFGEIFLNYGVIVYLAIAISIVTALILKKTRVGLHLRAVGENPATADAAGINVTKYKYLAIIIGGAIAGVGGFFYIMDYLGGSWQEASAIEALGWMSIALVIFTVWKPDLSIIGSIIFAFFYILAFKIQGISFTEMAALKLLPYIVTIIVLIITSIVGKKETQPPSSLGVNYFREER